MLRSIHPTAITLACLFAGAQAQSAPSQHDEWLLMSLRGKKVGYAHFVERPEGAGRFAESVTVLNGKMLGFDLETTSDSKTWSDAKGRTTRMEVETKSGGRLQKVVAVFQPDRIEAKSSTDGRETSKTIEIPEGASIVDDPMTPLLLGGAPKPVYAFDPNTLALVKCEPQVKGKETIDTTAGKVDATVIDMGDPRAPMSVYVSAKGDLLKAVGPFGLELTPATSEEALAESGDKAEIATASAIVPDREIANSLDLAELRLKVTGTDLSKLPSDAHQTVRRQGDAWLVTVHPVKPTPTKTKAKPDPRWLAADLHVPSAKPQFVKLAHQIAGSAEGTLERAEKIRRYVGGRVAANAGIGVLRDAEDVLSSGEGVCRDHAILMATLLRADGIPTRLVSGLVYADGAFYYHAWVEVWTQGQWVGLDSTRPSRRIDATHVKIAQGAVDQAFTSFLLDGAKITVLSP